MLCTSTDAELEEAASSFPHAWQHRFFAHDTRQAQLKQLLLKGGHALLSGLLGK